MVSDVSKIRGDQGLSAPLRLLNLLHDVMTPVLRWATYAKIGPWPERTIADRKSFDSTDSTTRGCVV